MASLPPRSATKKIVTCLLGIAFLVIGLGLCGGGIWLVVLGGSWYFALAGVGIIASGVLALKARAASVGVFLAVFAATIAWALLDAGFAFWPLFSRLFMFAVLGFLALLALPAFSYPAGSRPSFVASRVLAALFGLALVATGISMFQTHDVTEATRSITQVAGKPVYPDAGDDWSQWGKTMAGTRFAPLSQITPSNVATLQPAWTYRTGEVPVGGEGHVVTPLQIGDTLYGCTFTNKLFALDAETGAERWHYDAHAKGENFPRCRGVGYFDATDAVPQAPSLPQHPMLAVTDACARRVISTTVDDRIIEVDATTGRPCGDFGQSGSVDLKQGMGAFKPGLYFPTAAPTIVRGLVIVGGLVWDNERTNEPSGVVRAFDVRTGTLVWSWDIGNPATHGTPSAGRTYAKGTPNVWSAPSYDAALGLVYLPTGNATPDFWGGERSPESDRYSSSVVALDVATGQERWHFQTTHHDLWDYDVPAQPVLYDVPDGKGGTVPALVQVTKRGQIFMLDRRDGTPIATVEERTVPQHGAPDDRTSPTQPYSVGMPAIGNAPLTEARMWGITPLDQLVCRIEFKGARYEGEFTPPSPVRSIEFPGWTGGMNWGAASIAENRGVMVVNDTRIAIMQQLIPRTNFDKDPPEGKGHEGSAPQFGTPWGIKQSQFMSPLQIPCQQPPYGALTAIDLATRKVLWSKPIGTVQDTGPFGISMGLKMPIGLPTLGGSITTASGLAFYAGTQDHYLRAFDLMTGKELWKGRLPVGGEATPMTYVSPASGRQFVVISAGGNRATNLRGDYVMAFALPKASGVARTAPAP